MLLEVSFWIFSHVPVTVWDDLVLGSAAYILPTLSPQGEPATPGTQSWLCASLTLQIAGNQQKPLWNKQVALIYDKNLAQNMFGGGGDILIFSLLAVWLKEKK